MGPPKKAVAFSCLGILPYASNGAVLGTSNCPGEAYGCIYKRIAACHWERHRREIQRCFIQTVNKHSKKRTLRGKRRQVLRSAHHVHDNNDECVDWNSTHIHTAGLQPDSSVREGRRSLTLTNCLQNVFSNADTKSSLGFSHWTCSSKKKKSIYTYQVQ